MVVERQKVSDFVVVHCINNYFCVSARIVSKSYLYYYCREAGRRVGKCWEESGEVLGGEWGSVGRRVGKCWEESGEVLGGEWGSVGRRVGKCWEESGEVLGGEWGRQEVLGAWSWHRATDRSKIKFRARINTIFRHLEENNSDYIEKCNDIAVSLTHKSPEGAVCGATGLRRGLLCFLGGGARRN